MVTVYRNTAPDTQIPERPATPPELLPPNNINGSTSRPSLDVQVPEKVILVMGVTGSGKSRFIRTITGDSRVAVGDSLRSTTKMNASYGAVVDEQPYRFLDTPGFNDTERSETDILLSLSTWLCDLFRTGVTISGILYFHRISDERMQGSTLRSLRAFEALCGDASMHNAIFVTTYWDKVSPAIGEERETELKEVYWVAMTQKGANTARFDGTVEGAKKIVGSFQSREDIVLAIQREVVTDKRELSKTDVGRIIDEGLERSQKQLENELRQMQDNLRCATKMNDEIQAQMTAQVEKVQKELEQANMKKEWDVIRCQQELLNWEERYSILLQEEGNKRALREVFLGIGEFILHRLINPNPQQ